MARRPSFHSRALRVRAAGICARIWDKGVRALAMIFSPAVVQKLRMVFDDTKCLCDIGGTHANDISNRLRPTSAREVDDDFPARLPHVNVRRPMLARWKLDDDAKPIELENGRHRINKPSVGFAQEIAEARFSEYRSRVQKCRHESRRGESRSCTRVIFRYHTEFFEPPVTVQCPNNRCRRNGLLLRCFSAAKSV